MMILSAVALLAACTHHPAPSDAEVASLAAAIDRTVVAMGEAPVPARLRDAQADKLAWRLAGDASGTLAPGAMKARGESLAKRLAAATGDPAPRMLVWLAGHADTLDAGQRDLLTGLELQAEQDLGGGAGPAPSLQ